LVLLVGTGKRQNINIKFINNLRTKNLNYYVPIHPNSNL